MRTVEDHEITDGEAGAPPPPSPPTVRGVRGLTPWQWAVLGVAFLFLAGAVGYFVGKRADRAPGAGSVDVGFLQDMISHHEQAVVMSWLELDNGELDAVKTFAREIVYFQAYEIGLMESVLREWGYRREGRPDIAMEWMDMPVPVAEMPGMANEAEMAALTEARGRDADALFVRMMQDHHLGGVHMSEYAAEHASDAYVRELAARFARNQRIEINEMEMVARDAGLPAEPEGFEADVIPQDQPEHAGH